MDTKLLLLDDDETIRFNIKLYLEDEGYECTDVGDADSALSLIQKGGYSLSIVDLRLPGMNGEDFIIRSFVLNPNMKCLIHTGNTQYILSQELRRIGMKCEDVFYKPVKSFDKIVTRIKQLL